jgi:cell division protein FtsB
MTAMEILVIILSAFLALFLLIGIVLAVLLVRVTQQIRRVTTTAERTVNGLENVVASASKVTTPAMIAKVIMGQVSKRRKK